MMKGDKLNQPMHTAGLTLSLQLHQFFPFRHEVTMKWFTSSCCWNVKPTDVIRLELQNMKISHHIFVFKFILLSIFYSSLLYHSTNVIMLLDLFSHVAEILRPTDVVQLELQSLKVAEILSPLMLRLELQNMKISHFILSSNLYY